MQSKSTFLFFVMILLTSCAAPTPQPTATAVPTSTRAPVPSPTATQTLKPPSDSDASWIQNGDELFIFDSTSNEWIRAAQVSDTDPPVYEANGKRIITVGDEWLAVDIEADEDGKLTAVTDDGTRMIWGENGWEAVQVEQVASMEGFDYSLLWEKGAVIEVADYWGAGGATMTVEDTKGGTEALTYENMRVTPLSAARVHGIQFGAASFQFMKIEEMALVKVDLADNTRINDGYYCMVRLGTIDTNGEQISFTVVVDTNDSMDLDQQELFAKMKRGDSVGMSITFVPSGGVITDDLEAFLAEGDSSEAEELNRDFRFSLLGFGSQPVSLADVRNRMREGGVLGPAIIEIGNFRLDNP